MTHGDLLYFMCLLDNLHKYSPILPVTRVHQKSANATSLHMQLCKQQSESDDAETSVSISVVLRNQLVLVQHFKHHKDSTILILYDFYIANPLKYSLLKCRGI